MASSCGLRFWLMALSLSSLSMSLQHCDPGVSVVACVACFANGSGRADLIFGSYGVECLWVMWARHGFFIQGISKAGLVSQLYVENNQFRNSAQDW
jgi:hypothetical protein